jgi:hypothetical protein
MANEERGKLKTLLGYWVEHNEEHSQEFKEWADKADAMGEKQVAGEIRQAVSHMEKVTEILSGTMNKLGEG